MDGNKIALVDDDAPPFSVDLFKNYFKYTYCTAGQMLGVEVPVLRTLEPMVIVADVQSHHPNYFDYVALVHRLIDISLTKAKKDLSDTSFRHYSVLMHMVLYFGCERGMWSEELKIQQFDHEGQPLPIQLWMSIWDSRFARAKYAYFQEYFVKVIFRMFNHSCGHSLSIKIKIFLRPKNNGGPNTVKHNWGDWYCYSNATIIRVYGFEDTPFTLPRTMSGRLAYLEIVR